MSTSSQLDWSKVPAVLTSDNTVTLTFPQSVKDFFAPFARDGAIPLEHLAAVLAASVAARPQDDVAAVAQPW